MRETTGRCVSPCLPIIDCTVSCAAPEPVWGPCWWDQSPKSTEKKDNPETPPKTGRRQPSPKPGLPGARDPSRETPGYLLPSQVLLHSTVAAGLHPERSADFGGSSPQWESRARRSRPLTARCGHRWSTGPSRDTAAACKPAERHGTSRCIFTARSGCLDEMSPFQHVIIGHIWWYSSHATAGPTHKPPGSCQAGGAESLSRFIRLCVVVVGVPQRSSSQRSAGLAPS